MSASPAVRGLLVLAAAVACGCGGAEPDVVAASAPAPAAAAPSPTPPPAPNAAPTVAGDDRCIGALGADHVFVLVLDDPDGDAVAWEAEKDHGQGRLHQAKGGPVAAGTSVTVTYSPPLDRVDENWITVTARDARGATSVKRLYVKSG
jgi:hypothetical protein